MQGCRFVWFDTAFFGERLSYASHRFDKLNFSHSDEAFRFQLIDLSHHGAVEANEAVAFRTVSIQSTPLEDAPKLSKTHESLFSRPHLQLGIALINDGEDRAILFDEGVVVLAKVLLNPPLPRVVGRHQRQ